MCQHERHHSSAERASGTSPPALFRFQHGLHSRLSGRLYSRLRVARTTWWAHYACWIPWTLALSASGRHSKVKTFAYRTGVAGWKTGFGSDPLVRGGTVGQRKACVHLMIGLSPAMAFAAPRTITATRRMFRLMLAMPTPLQFFTLKSAVVLVYEEIKNAHYSSISVRVSGRLLSTL